MPEGLCLLRGAKSPLLRIKTTNWTMKSYSSSVILHFQITRCPTHFFMLVVSERSLKRCNLFPNLNHKLLFLKLLQIMKSLKENSKIWTTLLLIHFINFFYIKFISNFLDQFSSINNIFIEFN